MGTYQIGVLYGDGIGPEITRAAVDVLKAAKDAVGGVDFAFEELPMGWEGIETCGDPLPDNTVERLRQMHGWIMGPHDSASYPEQFQNRRNPSGELRHRFDLYANIRPAAHIPGIKCAAEQADLVIVRENTEGFYSDRNMYAGAGEFQITPDVVVTTGVFTRPAIERIAHMAYRLAQQRRGKVTIVHKANVIKLASGMFLQICREVGGQYPDVEVDDFHIDAMTAHLVRRAQDFDVIVAENMFGDILSDLTGELTGSLGLAPSINTNDHQAMAQAAHGSAPDIAGQNVANPVGIMLSTAMLLDWLASRHADPQLSAAAKSIRAAIFDAIAGGVKTKDLGGSATTRSFTEEVIARIGR